MKDFDLAPDIYYLYRHYPETEERRLVGKFVIFGLNLKILEDHDGILESCLRDGPIDSHEIEKIEKLRHSHYFEVVADRDLREGNRDQDIEELKLVPDGWTQHGSD